MARELYNLNQLGLVHTYDSGGQLPLPGVILGNERVNAGFAPDEDPSDLGLDTFANFDNGYGPQTDGDGVGFLADFDTNSANEGLFVAGVDDSDSGDASDFGNPGVVEPSHAGRNADNAFLAVRLSGTDDHAIDGPGQAIEQEPYVSDAFGTGPLADQSPFDHS